MPDDAEYWIARLRSAGPEQEAAISELREILLRGVVAASRNRYGGQITADDVVQDALLRILDKLDTFEGKSKFTTWAMTIAVRVTISDLRRRHHKDVSMSSLHENSMGFEPEAQPETDPDGIEKSILLTKLKELIDTKLTSKQRDVVHALLNDIPVEVYAEQTGSNRNAVYKLTHDARLKLREGFVEAGFDAIDGILSRENS